VRRAGISRSQRSSPAPSVLAQQGELEGLAHLQQQLAVQHAGALARTLPAVGPARTHLKPQRQARMLRATACCCAGGAVDQQAQLMAMMAAGMRPASATPPPLSHTPPLPAHTPPVPPGTPGAPGQAMQALAANAAALAAAAAGQNGFGAMHPAGMNGGMLGSLEYQAAYQVPHTRSCTSVSGCWKYLHRASSGSHAGFPCSGSPGMMLAQAAYQAALTQQAAAAQSLLMQQGGGPPYGGVPAGPHHHHHMGAPPGAFPGGHDALAAHVAAQLSMTPGYFNNPNINAAAAAAAAAAVQNLMGVHQNMLRSVC
jgi:hypothetical protein